MSYPPREGSRDIEDGILISEYPDYCRSPEAVIPYIIYAYQDNDANTAPTVRMTGKRSHTSASLITCCHGDEAGVGLGIKSNTKQSVCQPKTWSKTVRIEGNYAVRHNDTWWMNNKNTTGKMQYTRDLSIEPPTTPLQHPPEPADETHMPPPQDTSVFFSDAAQQAAAGGQTIMSDAAPSSMKAGGMYAQAAFAPNPAPAPTPPTTTPTPATPKGPGTVIRPDIPQWQRPPLPPKTPPSSSNNARWWQAASVIGQARKLNPLGVFLWGMSPTTLGDGTIDGHFQAKEQKIYDHVDEMRAQGLPEADVENWYNQAWDAYAQDYWERFGTVPPNAQTMSDESITPPNAEITSENVRVTGKAEDTNTNDQNCIELRDQIRRALYANKRSPGETDGYHGLLNRIVEQMCGADGPGTRGWDDHLNQIKGSWKRLKEPYDEFKDNECDDSLLSQSERDFSNNILNNSSGQFDPNAIQWLGRDHPRCLNFREVIQNGRLSDLLGIIRP